MNEMRVTKVKHLKGGALEVYTASVKVGGKSVEVVYDCNKKNLMINKWYKLTKDEQSAVSSFASAYFLSLMSGEATA